VGNGSQACSAIDEVPRHARPALAARLLMHWLRERAIARQVQRRLLLATRVDSYQTMEQGRFPGNMIN